MVAVRSAPAPPHTTSLMGAWEPAVTWVDVKIGDFNGRRQLGTSSARTRGSGNWVGVLLKTDRCFFQQRQFIGLMEPRRSVGRRPGRRLKRRRGGGRHRRSRILRTEPGGLPSSKNGNQPKQHLSLDQVEARRHLASMCTRSVWFFC